MIAGIISVVVISIDMMLGLGYLQGSVALLVTAAGSLVMIMAIIYFAILGFIGGGSRRGIETIICRFTGTIDRITRTMEKIAGSWNQFSYPAALCIRIISSISYDPVLAVSADFRSFSRYPSNRTDAICFTGLSVCSRI